MEKRAGLKVAEAALRAEPFRPFSAVEDPVCGAVLTLVRPVPFLGTAIHAGHRVRENVLSRMAVSGDVRRMEEDPFTDRFAALAPLRLVQFDSRFEYDVNRPPKKAVYRKPEDAWDIEVWKSPPTEDEIRMSREKYRRFHELVDTICRWMIETHDGGLLIDFHSFNRRAPGGRWREDEKPEIDLGTHWMKTPSFRPFIEEWKKRLREIRVGGRPLRVMENVPFKGGYMVKRISETFGDRILAVAIEVKKIFMDERTGELLPEAFKELCEGLRLSLQKTLEKEALLPFSII